MKIKDRSLKIKCKKNTLFRLKDDDKNEWRIVKLSFDRGIKTMVVNEWGRRD